MSDQHLELVGEIVDVNRNGFRVLVDETETIIFAKLSGRLRKNRIRILLGDEVKVRVSVHDLTHGQITYRL